MTDINKIHDAMKVLKEECKKSRCCEDCIFFYYSQSDPTKCCYLEKEPGSWEEDKIVENDCTTAHRDGLEEWLDPVFKCNNCDGTFMLGGSHSEHIIGKFCPHCGKKIINYKEDE